MFIEPTTEAKTRSITLKVGQTIQVRGTLSTDIIAIEIPDGNNGWKSLTEIIGGVATVIQLTENQEQQTAYGNTLIRVNKPVTSNSVGVAII